MAESRDKKILRIGLIQNGKIVEERLLRRREAVTIGQSPRNTFVLSSGGLPKTYNLFDIKGNTYHLNFRSGMNGKISLDDSVMDFRALREQKLARKRGANYTVRLSERSRGKVMLGDLTVLFQFVTPPPPPSTLQLPASLRGGWSQRMDWQFMSALMGSFVLQVFSLAFVMTQDYPPPPRGIETLGDRFTEVVFEQKEIKPPPPKPNKDEKVDENKKSDETKPKEKVAKEAEPKEAPKESPEDKARRKAKELRRMQKEVANKTILKFVGSKGGDGAPSILDSLKDGATDTAIAKAFEGSGVTVAKNSSTARDRRIGSSTGKTAGLSSGDLKGRKAGKVSSGGKGSERKVRGAVKIKKPSEAFGTGVLDPASIAKVVGRRKSAIKACYEKQLKKNPKLSGKVKIQFTVLESGRVGDVQVLADSTGEPAVGSCIKSSMKRWRFPKPDGGSVTVAFPFVFQPSS